MSIKKTAKWISHYECSNCGELSASAKTECPFCHAKMERLLALHIDREELKYLDMVDFPNDPKELEQAIHEAIKLAYLRV